MSENLANPQSWPILSPLERRLLGVLIEKQKTTPDVYPLSLNSLVTGCNQKSNRDPLMSVEDHEVEETMADLQKLALATRVESGRVDKWRHLLYERWLVAKPEIAVIAELLLRGPQTEGDLRSRVSRMEPVADLDALRAVCKPMSERGLVVYLTPEGRRGTMLTHGFHDPAELNQLKSRAGSGDTSAEAPRPAPSAARPPQDAGLSGRVDHLHAEAAELRKLISDLRFDLAETRSQLESLKAALGGPPSTPSV
jgi:uncharacterized protein YceH (UPF0502 family)